MRGLIALHLRLQDIGERTTVNSLKLIPLLLGIPCFHLIYLLFKIIYFSQERRFALLNTDRAFSRGQNLIHQLRDLRFNLMGLLQIRNVLHEAVRRLEPGNHAADRIGIGHG